eukprot:GHUV01023001.1.p1 GENE.GHUV01023001.1~~GHUV01023001.1.p1  ORF type:complete len:224 (+),score=57.71 GHUV01023001.1:303-974(+)
MADSTYTSNEDQPTAKFELETSEMGPMQGSVGPPDIPGLSTISLDDPVVSTITTTIERYAGQPQQEPQQQQQIGGSADTIAFLRAPAMAEAPAAPTALAETTPQGPVTGSSSSSIDNSNGADPAAVGSLHVKNLPIKVWVKNPEKHEVSRIGVTFHSYVTYLLRTECSSHIFPDAAEASTGAKEGAHVFEVRRRFADFEMLHRLLRSHYRGYFLPPLPDKVCG